MNTQKVYKQTTLSTAIFISMHYQPIEYALGMRFVLLHHTGWPDHSDHFDLMLQTDAGENDERRVLKTFSTVADVFPTGERSTGDSGGDLNVFRLGPPHRRAYLKFEGPVTENRGVVVRIDEGELDFVTTTRPGRDEIVVRLIGVRLKGEFRFVPTDEGLFRFEKIR